MKECLQCGEEKLIIEFSTKSVCQSCIKANKKSDKKALTNYKMQTQKEKLHYLDSLPFNDRKTLPISTSMERRALSLLCAARKRARRNKAVLSINKAWVMEKLTQGKCELTGISFSFENSTPFFIDPYAPSIDRIDAKNLNYSPSNSRVVLTSVNSALGQWGTDTMLPILEKLVQSLANKSGAR